MAKKAGRRTTLDNRAGSFYAKRTRTGQFKELDEKGRSLASDRRRKAKRASRSGFGDQGDRARGGRKRR
jgi:hypothetical protein